MKFKHRLKRLALYLLLLFVVLFGARLAYGYYAYPNGDRADNAAVSLVSSYGSNGGLRTSR